MAGAGWDPGGRHLCVTRKGQCSLGGLLEDEGAASSQRGAWTWELTREGKQVPSHDSWRHYETSAPWAKLPPAGVRCAGGGGCTRGPLDSGRSLWPHDTGGHSTPVRTGIHVTLHRVHTSHSVMDGWTHTQTWLSWGRGSGVHPWVPAWRTKAMQPARLPSSTRAPPIHRCRRQEETRSRVLGRPGRLGLGPDVL